jgi:hypothetical protein
MVSFFSNKEVLSLSSNDFTGKIPQLVGSGIKKLEQLSFSENNLSGNLPEEICQWKNLSEFDPLVKSFRLNVLNDYILTCIELLCRGTIS